MSQSPLSLTSVVAVADHVSVADMGEEIFIFEYDSEKYYGVSDVAARIWQLIKEPRTVQAVLDVLLDEYDVDPTECQRDLFAFLDNLLTVGSITVKPSPPA